MSDIDTGQPYRVLARKYRPQTFAELIGQEALVRTLSNAIEGGRLAHAFLLTGVRGVGKTTTARIIARALNCVGPDGAGGPTVEPCGACDNCRAIAEDRHVDVMEMDAASRTGVDDIRELIDGVRYLPVQARFKVYIIDEVHMLSRNAFNALLKTLEEPPAQVVFIFATTEVRKVPVTVLSRCQRFDLRRVDAERLIGHFAEIAEKEGAALEPEALALIARAAEGSVRDGLSLLDQAIAHGAGTVGADEVRAMLGLADRGGIFDLFESLMAGDVPGALDALRRQYDAGAEPVVVLQDLLELTHWITTVKVVPEIGDDVTLPEHERARGREIAGRLGMPILARAWQMLLKGLAETRTAPAPLAAAEMILIRIAYAADLPDPGTLVRSIASDDAREVETPRSEGARASAPPAAMSGGSGGGPLAARALATETAEPQETPSDFAAVVALFGARKELILQSHLANDVNLVRFEEGLIEFRPGANAPRSLASDVGQKLTAWTGRRWIVTVSREPGEPPLAERRLEGERERRREIEAHPLVKAALQAFPGAEIRDVRPLATPEGEEAMIKEATEGPARPAEDEDRR